MGADGLPRNARVRVRLGAMDDISLDIGGTVVERLDARGRIASAPRTTTAPTTWKTWAARLTIAVDLSDAEAADAQYPCPQHGCAHCSYPVPAIEDAVATSRTHRLCHRCRPA
jgi:exoribonuclease-2